MLFALDTSHLEMLALNNAAPWKMALMSVTRDTSHSPIRPYGASIRTTPFSQTWSPQIGYGPDPIGFWDLGQSPCGDKMKQVSTALLRSVLDCGENVNAIVPKDPTNMSVLIALE